MLALSEPGRGHTVVDSKGGQKGPALGSVLGYGLTWTVSTVAFLLIGSALDRWLGTKPLLTLVGAFIGAGAGFYYMYHHLVVAPREREAERREQDR
jgi:F0F1-type ATP synthase assembly protein I